MKVVQLWNQPDCADDPARYEVHGNEKISKQALHIPPAQPTQKQDDFRDMRCTSFLLVSWMCYSFCLLSAESSLVHFVQCVEEIKTET